MTTATAVRPLVLAALIVVAGPRAGAAPGVGGMERVVPADARLFIGIDDVGALQRDFQRTSLGRWIASAEFTGVREFLGEGLTALTVDVAEDEAGLLEVASMIHGGAAIALLDVGAPRADGGVPVAVGVFLEAGKDELRVLDAVDRALKRDIDSGVFLRTTEAVGEGQVTRIAPPDPPAPAEAPKGILEVEVEAPDPTELRYAVHRGVFVAVISSESLGGADRIGAILAGLNDELPQSLRDAGTFQRSGAALPGAHLRGFLDVGGLLASALAGLVERGKLAEDDVRRIAALGVYDITEVAFTIGFADAGTEARLDLHWSGEGAIPTFLQALLKPTALRTPSLFPRAPRAAFAAAVDLRGGLAALLGMMQQLMPDEGAQIADLVDATLHQGDLDLERDVLGNVDGEIGAYMQSIVDDLEALPGTEDDPRGLAVIVPLRDGAALSRVMEVALEETGIAAVRTKLQFGGREVHKMPGGFVRSLYVAIDGDLAIFATAREVMAATLGRRQQAGDALADSLEYQATLDDLAGGLPGIVWVGDSAVGANDLLAGFLAALKKSPIAGPGGDLPFEPPSLETVGRYFDGVAVRVLTVDQAGIRLRSRATR